MLFRSPATGVGAVTMNVTDANATAGSYHADANSGHPQRHRRPGQARRSQQRHRSDPAGQYRSGRGHGRGPERHRHPAHGRRLHHRLPGNSARPTTSNLDFRAGQTTANQATVPIDSSRQIKLYNATGQTDLPADVQGYFGTTGGVYVPLTAMPRMLDTRIGYGAPQMRAVAGESLTVQFTDRFGIMPDGDGTAALLNLTGINPSTSTCLAVESPGETVATSDDNLAPGETRAGLAVAPVTRYFNEGYFTLYNAFGKLDIVADLQGYYAPTP